MLSIGMERKVYIPINKFQKRKISFSIQNSKFNFGKENKNAPSMCSGFSLSSPFYAEYFTMRVFLLRKNFNQMLRQFQKDVYLKDKKATPRTPKFNLVRIKSY